MTQLSRPYQIALVAMALFVAVWFLALRGRTTTQESGSVASSASPVVASAQLAQSEAKSAATPTPVHSGTAPGVAGLTRAINKAHGAVAKSQLNAKQLEEKSAQASTPGVTPATTAAPSTTAAKPPAAARAKIHAATAAPAPRPAPAVKRHSVAKGESAEASVEAQLAHGKLVAILFWNPKSTVDQTVGRELAAAARSLNGKLAIHVAGADQVGTFGSITREVQVNQTPTILLIRKTGSTMVLTGLTDAYAIEQALDELRA